VTDAMALRARLARIRADGYAWVRDEFAEGLSSVAAPVVVGGSVVAAVHVHGPSYRFPPSGSEVRLGRIVTAGAEAVARSLLRAGAAAPPVNLVRAARPATEPLR
jgi:DNA-binding IclR family transcriptional regulator